MTNSLPSNYHECHFGPKNVFVMDADGHTLYVAVGFKHPCDSVPKGSMLREINNAWLPQGESFLAENDLKPVVKKKTGWLIKKVADTEFFHHKSSALLPDNVVVVMTQEKELGPIGLWTRVYHAGKTGNSHLKENVYQAVTDRGHAGEHFMLSKDYLEHSGSITIMSQHLRL